jgi:hypothetical protein
MTTDIASLFAQSSINKKKKVNERDTKDIFFTRSKTGQHLTLGEFPRVLKDLSKNMGCIVQDILALFPIKHKKEHPQMIGVLQNDLARALNLDPTLAQVEVLSVKLVKDGVVCVGAIDSHLGDHGHADEQQDVQYEITARIIGWNSSESTDLCGRFLQYSERASSAGVALRYCNFRLHYVPESTGAHARRLFSGLVNSNRVGDVAAWMNRWCVSECRTNQVEWTQTSLVLCLQRQKEGCLSVLCFFVFSVTMEIAGVMQETYPRTTKSCLPC